METIWDPSKSFTLAVQEMFYSGSKYPQLAAIKLLFEINRNRFREGTVANTQEDLRLCIGISEFIRKRQVMDEVNEKALQVLYYNLELMPQTLLEIAFDRAKIFDTLETLKKLEGGDDNNIVQKILDMPEGGNAVRRAKETFDMVKATTTGRSMPRERPIARDNFGSRGQGQQGHYSPEKGQGASPPYERRMPVKMSIANLNGTENVMNSDPEDDQAQRDERPRQAGEEAAASSSKYQVYSNEMLDLKNGKTCQLIEARHDKDIPKDEVGKHILAFLNSGRGGQIIIGVSQFGIVQGVHLDRKKRDYFRQGEIFPRTLIEPAQANYTLRTKRVRPILGRTIH